MNGNKPLPADTRAWLWGGAVLLLTFVAYLPVLHAGLLWDDNFMVTDNMMLRSGQGLHDIWFTTRPADPYPITLTTFWFEWHLWGLRPLGYHIVNVVMHGFAAVIFWRVLLRLGVPGAWLAAAVFAVHPVGAASAAWVSEQKNTCSILFYLLAILFYLRFDSGGGLGAYGLALFLYVCALLCKGSVVMAPVVLLLAICWRRGRLARRDLLRLLPWFLLSLASGATTIWFQNHKAIAGEMVQDLGWPGRFAAAAWAVWFYLWKAWLPVNLCVIYPQWRTDVANPLCWLPAVALIAVFAAAWVNRAAWGRHVLFGFGAFVVTLFPVMGFFNMYFLVYSRVADHWQYLALLCSVPLAVGAAVACQRRLAETFRWPAAAGSSAAAVLLMALSAATWHRAAIYAAEEPLWQDTVNKNPKAWMAWNNLGNAFGAQNRTPEAITAYSRAIAVNSNFPDAHSNLGNCLVAQGKLDEAIRHFRKAIAVEPRLAKFHFNLAIPLGDQGKYDEAISEYNTAIQLDPAGGDARNNLANVLIKLHRYQDALNQALIAVQLKPDASEPCLNVAEALDSLGRTAESVQYYQKAIALRPGNATARCQYGLMLAMHGDLQSALPQFQEVVRLKPGDAPGHGCLGNTLAGLKRLDEAIGEFQIAIRLDPNDAQNHNNLATALVEKGDLAAGVEQYAIAVRLKPDDAGTRANYAYALAKQGNRQEAIKQYQEALRLNPGNQSIQQQLRSLSH